MQMDQVPGPMPSAGEEYTPPFFFKYFWLSDIGCNLKL